MCGIVGYVGSGMANEFLVEGLRRLEYRGYDSAGTATMNGTGDIRIIKSVGRISGLANKISQEPNSATVGIGHTRWATHGAPNESNAHPHYGGHRDVAVAHNGVIENHAELRQLLTARGYTFVSDTDTEVVAHLIADLFKEELERNNHDPTDLGIPEAAVRRATRRLRGTYGLAVVFQTVSRRNICRPIGQPPGDRRWPKREFSGQRCGPAGWIYRQDRVPVGPPAGRADGR